MSVFKKVMNWFEGPKENDDEMPQFQKTLIELSKIPGLEISGPGIHIKGPDLEGKEND